MPLSEFTIIDRYFKKKFAQRSDVALGIGDDCALLKPHTKKLLAVSMDTLVSGVHFPAETSAYDIAYKAAAVNLSDLAAMGATPAWATLALTMPEADKKWLQQFCAGLTKAFTPYEVQLIGGDLTKGPLSITIQIHGFVANNAVLRRDAAKAGDKIYVTGPLGSAMFGLKLLQEKITANKTDSKFFINALNRPQPKVKTGIALATIANAAIDISDGLCADLQHILQASAVGATLYTEKIPFAKALNKYLTHDKILSLVLAGGDDYELCFTVSAQHEKYLKKLPFEFCEIGVVEEKLGLRVLDNGKKVKLGKLGYKHF